MKDSLIVKSSPHICSKSSTQKIMLNVIVSLLPCIIASTILFGLRSLRIVAFCSLFCMILEIIYSLLARKRVLVEDFSAVLTGVLLGLNLPIKISIYSCFIGSFAAIIIAKQLFGGIGQNFVNPALFGRAVMLICFPEQMTNWTSNKGLVDITSSATPLQVDNISDVVNLQKLLLGIRGGCVGETCIIAIALGFIYLCITRTINPIIPLSFFGSGLLFILLFGGEYLEIFCGGLCFASVFMATDYVTSPTSNLGKLIFGISCGFLTILLRKFASAPEGVTTAILFMNLTVPYINKFSLATPFGTGKKAIRNV